MLGTEPACHDDGVVPTCAQDIQRPGPADALSEEAKRQKKMVRLSTRKRKVRVKICTYYIERASVWPGDLRR
jgi:hypothetical protein